MFISQWNCVANNNETCSLESSDYFYLGPLVLDGPSGAENSHFSFSNFYTVKLILLREIPVLDNTMRMPNSILEVKIAASQLLRLERGEVTHFYKLNRRRENGMH